MIIMYYIIKQSMHYVSHVYPLLVNLQFLGVIIHPYAILYTTFCGCTTNETPTFDFVNSWPVSCS